jgi:lipopolysaccharide biosynthesis glycosyltransferase
MHVVTLVTGDYVFGAAALINSLARAGFAGQITVGHQGPIDWQIQSGAPVVMRRLSDSQKWGGSLKAEFLLSLGDGEICFIDADCIVTSSKMLDLIDQVVTDRPLLAVEGIIAAGDVRRYVWARKLPAAKGAAASHELACVAYLNSGFLALNLPRDLALLEQWREAISQCLIGTGQLFETPFFPMADQDCLNAVVAALGTPVATIGPPDVWYRAQPVNPYLHVGAAAEPVLLHCTGKLKPWLLRRPAVLSPDIYDRLFYRFAFQETPWVRLPRRLPRGVEQWLKDGLWSRLSRKARQAASRVAQLAGA